MHPYYKYGKDFLLGGVFALILNVLFSSSRFYFEKTSPVYEGIYHGANIGITISFLFMISGIILMCVKEK